MAHWQIGAKDRARSLYDKAIVTMQKNHTTDEQVSRFLVEAAALLERDNSTTIMPNGVAAFAIVSLDGKEEHAQRQPNP